MRPRFSAAGGKSDGFDAFVLAELARTDSHRFRVLVPDSDADQGAARAVARARGARRASRRAGQRAARAAGVLLARRSARVRRHRQPDRARVPQALPGAGRRARPRRAAHAALPRPPPLLRAKPASELLHRLRGAAQGRAAALESEARRQIVLALVAALEPIVARISELTSEIRAGLHDHADGPTFRSLFRDPKSAVCAAAMLSEIGDCRDRYPTKATLAADGGQAPSPSNRASPSAPASAGPATTASEPRSARSPTPAATTTRGPTAPAGPTRSASSPSATPPATSPATPTRSSTANSSTRSRTPTPCAGSRNSPPAGPPPSSSTPTASPAPRRSAQNA